MHIGWSGFRRQHCYAYGGGRHAAHPRHCRRPDPAVARRTDPSVYRPMPLALGAGLTEPTSQTICSRRCRARARPPQPTGSIPQRACPTREPADAAGPTDPRQRSGDDSDRPRRRRSHRARHPTLGRPQRHHANGQAARGSHRDIMPVIDIYASTQGLDLGSVSTSVDKVLKQMQGGIPHGASVSVQGQSVTDQRRVFAALDRSRVFDCVGVSRDRR